MKEDQQESNESSLNLKERIIAVLKAKNLSYSQLVEYLGLTEEMLDHALEQNTIEIRTLELISKELRIPLYSFFRDASLQQQYSGGQQYYNVNIWAPEEIHLLTENETLRTEVERLRMEIAKKELIIQGMEQQLKKKL